MRPIILSILLTVATLWEYTGKYAPDRSLNTHSHIHINTHTKTYIHTQTHAQRTDRAPHIELCGSSWWTRDRTRCGYAWVMSHIWMSHVTHMNESCPTYEWVMSHGCMSHVLYASHVSHTNESCPTFEWVMSHTRMSHAPHMNESCLTHEWVMPLICMSHVSHMTE